MFPKGMTDRQRLIAQRERRQKVATMLLRGITNHSVMAAAVGVAPCTVWSDVKHIRQNWLRDDCRMAKYEAALRVKQLEYGALKAMESYERSRQDSEEITTDYVPRKCIDCKGTGFIEGTTNWCLTCDSTGSVLVEHVVRKVKGQAGSAAHLAVYTKAISDIAKIKGCYPLNNQVTDNSIGKTVIQASMVDYSKAPAELLLRAREACYLLTQSVGGSDVVDVVAEKKEEPA